MNRLRPSASAASAINVDVIDGYDPDDAEDAYAPIRAAWNGRTLDATVPGLPRALCELANHCDYLADEPAVSREERKFYRRASLSLSTLHIAGCKAVRL